MNGREEFNANDADQREWEALGEKPGVFFVGRLEPPMNADGRGSDIIFWY